MHSVLYVTVASVAYLGLTMLNIHLIHSTHYARFRKATKTCMLWHVLVLMVLVVGLLSATEVIEDIAWLLTVTSMVLCIAAKVTDNQVVAVWGDLIDKL